MAMYGGSLVKLARGLGNTFASWRTVVGYNRIQHLGIFSGALVHQGIAVIYQKLPRISDRMHSENAFVDFPNLRVISLAASQDNFMYLLIDKATGQAAVVDPLEPDTVLKTLQQEKATLTSVLTTHHHWDHAGGNEKLLQMHQTENGNAAKLEVYGGDDRILALSKKVGHQDIITVGSLKIECIFTPCHTTGHICYYVRTNDIDMQKPLVFTGDTLFVAGCGRFFEGNAAQMHDALINKLGTLPAETLVFCGHEYTVANLKFVLYVDNNNKAAQTKLAWAENQRSKKLPTVPSTIGDELDFNIFMRVGIPTLQLSINANDGVSCMDKLRTMKNNFS